MQDKSKNIWIGKEDLRGDIDFVEKESAKFFDLPVAQEFADAKSELMNTTTKRRDFLKMMGFSIGAATIAASCETPVRRAIPYVTKPDAIVPGVPTYYASTFVKGGDILPILVKTREGRPIKIEGNKMSLRTKGGTSARAQASVLDLYDTNRFPTPMKGEEKIEWAAALLEIKSKLKSSKNIYLISNTITSPTLNKVIDDFVQKYPGAKHVVYDSVSSAAMLDANKSALGQRAIPSFDFAAADVIVSFDADFLGTWLSPVEYTAAFSSRRNAKMAEKGILNRLYAVESAMTLTGSNADNRIVIKPSESGLAMATVYNKVATALGGSKVSLSTNLDEKTNQKLVQVADDLVKASRSGKPSLIVCGSNNLGEQLLAIELNRLLGNYGKSIHLDRPGFIRQGDDKALKAFNQSVEAGRADMVIVLNDANPLYDTPYASNLVEKLTNANVVFLGTRPSETSKVADYVLPVHHNLESWGDAEAYSGEVTLIQPVIEPLHNSKATVEILANLADQQINAGEDRADYALLREMWGGNELTWQTALHDGMTTYNSGMSLSMGSVNLSQAQQALAAPSSVDKEIKFYETVNMGAGQYATNPWLQEMPDPIYRTVWDNFVTIPVTWDGNRTIKGMNGWETGDLVAMKIGDNEIIAPVVDQFGVKDGAHGMAIGYGRTNSGRCASDVGINVYPMLTMDNNGYIQYYASISFDKKVGKDERFASVQYHHTYGIKDTDPKTGDVINVDERSISAIAAGYQGALTDRSVLFYSDANELGQFKKDLHHHREHAQYLNQQTIYAGHDKLYDNGHKWEMSIDLNACTGCGACQVACVAENNVPVVGKTEVNRHHEMTWLRIDRYFFGDIESPNTAYQPMMCQHCDNAPCENVCPVGATQHSSEGLNHMTYNRCIGTRYCANNCPYKVRRFNWLDYTTADLFGANENDPLPGEAETPFYAENMTRMVLNPDVTVRSRGVIEKCSFCIQKIQSIKLTAKSEGRKIDDEEVQTACSSACPSGAIVFGDINDKSTQVAQRENSPLNYYVLEETNVRSAVGYLSKVTNRNELINKIDA